MSPRIEFVVLSSLFAFLLAGLPAMIVEYLLCRRYLQRTAVTTGSA